MRVVLDTNVFVSSVMGGRLGVVLDYWRADRFVLVVSSEIVREYIGVLRRPKFGLPQEVVDDIGAYLIRKAEFVTPQERLRVVSADPTDDKFLEAAIAGQSDFLISGDHHLLTLGEFRGVAILTARAFLDRLQNEAA